MKEPEGKRSTIWGIFFSKRLFLYTNEDIYTIKPCRRDKLVQQNAEFLGPLDPPLNMASSMLKKKYKAYVP